MILELLYRLRPGEEQDRPITPFLSDGVTSSAGVQVERNIRTVPADRVMFLTTASLLVEPGAGQNIENMSIVLRSPEVNLNIDIVRDFTVRAANVDANLNFSGMILVPPRWSVIGRATFNAGAIANDVTIDITSFDCPLGNVDRVQ